MGRAYAYGLGALGEEGVTRALEVIRAELDVSMALCGIREIREATPAILR
ncbi:MAG TPA: alpha-hydroxy-acid oxidizing protein [Burkholderiales bacterium]|nr:alpha-hydroxy-acid oxidizing protein [Burkholderiales bacterium]